MQIFPVRSTRVYMPEKSWLKIWSVAWVLGKILLQISSWNAQQYPASRFSPHLGEPNKIQDSFHEEPSEKFL